MKVKISGDGRRISHSSNLFVCSFAFVEDGKRCLSSAGTLYTILLLKVNKIMTLTCTFSLGNHTIAIVKGKEEYATL